ncbi:hypothetical protein OG930_40075 [Streptomyces sp. NBC_01799]|nr:hypothetical protein [Streptomyces sp. NBC_01800]WSA72704.1 hypothetical protein OIE65_40670 [Streptomyces sp. NBC_01800]WSA81231.1 hypothetical protein OG930_40075 [Streptomyces sp. NBC_01799]
MKIVLMSDPRVAAIPVQDCGEELIDTRASGHPSAGFVYELRDQAQIP